MTRFWFFARRSDSEIFSSTSVRSARRSSFAGIFARSASTTEFLPATASPDGFVSRRDSGRRLSSRRAGRAGRAGAASASRRLRPGRVIEYSNGFLVGCLQ